MTDRHASDWDPRSDAVQRDQRAAYDGMRDRCPVAWSDYQGWSVFRHADVLRVVEDHETFSNAVSRHLSVPNGMDPPKHGPYRAMIEPYFSPERVAAFEPRVRGIAHRLLSGLPDSDIEVMDELALPFAARVQCAFMGWPDRYAQRLIQWNARNHEATLAGDRPAMAEIATDFQTMVDELLQARRDREDGPEADVTASLMHERVDGEPLSLEAITSIIRNWTVGEVGTISASVGILIDALATDGSLLGRLRRQPALIPGAVDEILRRHGPLVTNRRVATRDADLGGRRIRAGDRVSVNWVAANRDPAVFDRPDELRFDRDPSDNLLYGAGIHVCPGAGLARMELRVFVETLLTQIAGIRRITSDDSGNNGREPAVYPAIGFARLPVRLLRQAGDKEGEGVGPAQAYS